MKCKFCDTELEEGVTLCPSCGREITEELAEEVACEETCECTCEDSCEEACTCDADRCSCEKICEESSEETCQEQPVTKPGLKGWKLGLLIAGGVVLLGILVGAVLYGLGINMLPRENNNLYKDSYTVSDEVLDRKENIVVAKIGDRELTNGQLQIYYWMQVYDYLNYYGNYFNVYKDLDQQMVGDMTYQQYFLDIALETWQRYETLGLLADESGFTLSQELQADLDAIPEQLKEMAEEEYESVEDMLYQMICPGATEKAYLAYSETYFKGYGYYESIYDSMLPTQEEIEAYFTQNEATFKQSNVTKESGMKADVRHILICPEGGTEDETGNVTYSEAEWEQCLAKAEELLEQWKNGDATEESFAELANEHSEDGGSNTTGGLYTDITPTTNFVPNFLNWTIDENRKVGDTGIVESPYGYHIMYYVGGEPIWIDAARSAYVSEQTEKLLLEGMERWPMDVNYKKIVLGYVDLAG